MAAPGKQYGLILPKKMQQRPVLLKKPSVFADDSDEEVSVAKSLQKEEIKKKLMKQTKLEMHKALEEDATIYEYDSIYDEIQQKKAEESRRLLAGQDKKPKYIASLMKAVEIRKKEQEKRMEKKIQKERESEDGQFDDKEAFVTSAYKAKLQERVEEEERERKEAALEAALDVTKQKDLSGFYRHLLNQTVGEEKTPKCSLRGTGVKQKESRVYPGEVSSSDTKEKLKNGKNRSQTPEPELENLDADSDFEIDSDEEEEESKSKKKLHYKHQGDDDHADGSKADSKKYEIQNQASSQCSGDDQRDCYQKDEGRAVESKYDQSSSLRKNESSGHKDKPKTEKCKSSEYERQIDKYKSAKDTKGKKESRQREEDCELRDKNKDEQENKSRDKEEKHREHRREKEKEGQYIEKRMERHAEDKQDKYSERGREKSKSSLADGCMQEKNREEIPRENDKRISDSFRRDATSASSKKEKNDDSAKPSEKEKHKDSARLSELKHKVSSEKNDDASSGLTKNQHNKFSKRSTEETVMTARERFFARQLARLTNKSYIEKEED